MSKGQITSEPTAGPWVEVNLDALCANFALIKGATNAETAAVVKCDGYGLGAAKIAQTLAQREGCRSFFVAYPEEGVRLRKALKDLAPDAAIYVFSGPLPKTIDHFKSANLIPVLNTPEQAKNWSIGAPNAIAAVHVETGMNRLSASETDFKNIAAINDLNVDLIMSHLACSSQPAHPHNVEQLKRFRALADLFPNARRSLAASGGSLMKTDYHFDLLRVGIALYGGSPFDDADDRISPVAALKAPIIQIRTIGPGAAVGYDATFKADRVSHVATVALGYGDGYPRMASNRAEAALNGGRVPVVGRVSMDLITLDVTDLPQTPQVGDIVEFFGPTLPIHDVATACGTISYELLTGLGGRVDHRYL